MAAPLPNINITLENDDLGQEFKDKINGLVAALNENRTEFNNQLAAETTAGQKATIATNQAGIAETHKNDAEAAAIAANNAVAGSHTHDFSGVTGLQAALDAHQTQLDTHQGRLDTLEINISRARRLALAGI